MKIEKGDYGYVKSQKLKRLGWTLGFFAIPVAVFLFGFIINKGDRMNIYSVIAAVGCIPGALSAVTMITMWLRKPISETLYGEIQKVCGSQTLAYELYVTTQEASLFFDAVLFSGDAVTAYCDRTVKKDDAAILQAHIKKSLKTERYDAVVKIFGQAEKKQFFERLRAGAQAWESRDHSREEGMKQTLLLLSL